MHHSIPAAHAQHDLLLIAGHAAGDLSDAERTRADAVLASCTTCADIRRDLLAIAAATHSLPTIARAPRDFRLTPGQAASLRRGGLRKSLLRPFAAQRSGVRPMAMAFTSLGLAGLLVANILPGLFGSTALLAPFPAAGGAAEATAAANAPSAVADRGPAAQPEASDGSIEVQVGQPTSDTGKSNDYSSQGQASQPPHLTAAGGPTSDPSANRTDLVARERSIAESNPIFVVSLALLALGLALFAIRFAARRAR